jgi:hypothetical protein
MMSRRLWVLFGLTGTVFGVLLALLTLRRDGGADSPQGSSVPAVIGEGPRPAPRPRLATPRPPPPRIANGGREAEQLRQLFKGATGEIPQIYNLEPRDQTWASPMEGAVNRRLLAALQSRAVPDLGYSDIECRTTTCRIVFEYRGTDPLPEDERARNTRVNKLVGELVRNTGALASSWASIPAPPEDAGLRATYVIRFREDAHDPGRYEQWVSDYYRNYQKFLASRKAVAPATSTP